LRDADREHPEMVLFSGIFRCVIPKVRGGKISPEPVNFRKIIFVCICFENFFNLRGSKVSVLILNEYA